jgi:lactate dehydrogenase-like 2-hydroxyacid dehydrogenase
VSTSSAVADFAFALLLAVARHVVKADHYSRSTEYVKYEHVSGSVRCESLHLLTGICMRLMADDFPRC